MNYLLGLQFGLALMLLHCMLGHAGNMMDLLLCLVNKVSCVLRCRICSCICGLSVLNGMLCYLTHLRIIHANLEQVELLLLVNHGLVKPLQLQDLLLKGCDLLSYRKPKLGGFYLYAGGQVVALP